jgi:hypothetical protein
MKWNLIAITSTKATPVLYAKGSGKKGIERRWEAQGSGNTGERWDQDFGCRGREAVEGRRVTGINVKRK